MGGFAKLFGRFCAPLSPAAVLLFVLAAESVLASLGNYGFRFQCSIIQTMGMIVERTTAMHRFDSPNIDDKVGLSDKRRVLTALGFARAESSISVVSPRKLVGRDRTCRILVNYWVPFKRGEKDVIEIDGEPAHISHWGYLAPARTMLYQTHTGPSAQPGRKKGCFIMSTSPIRPGDILSKLIAHRQYVDELVDESEALLDVFYPRPQWNIGVQLSAEIPTKRLSLTLPGGIPHPMLPRSDHWLWRDVMRFLVLALPAYMARHHPGRHLAGALLEFFPGSRLVFKRSDGESCIARAMNVAPLTFYRYECEMVLMKKNCVQTDQAIAQRQISGRPFSLVCRHRVMVHAFFALVAQRADDAFALLEFGYDFRRPSAILGDREYASRLTLDVVIPVMSRLGDAEEALLALRQMQVDPAAFYDALEAAGS